MSSAEDPSARVSLMSENFGSWTYPIATAVVLFVAWEAIARLGAISPLLLPAPSAVLVSTVNNFPLLMKMSVVTASEFLLGFALSVVIGVPLGALIVYARPIELALYPLLVAFQTKPNHENPSTRGVW